MALGKEARAVPIGATPQAWLVCPEDLEVGPGSFPVAGLGLSPLTPCSVFGVAKLNRDLGKKKRNSS